MSNKQFNTALNLNVSAELVENETESETIAEDYKNLNDKMDKVILKIKDRKAKKKKNK